MQPNLSTDFTFSQAFKPKTDISDLIVKTDRKAPRQAKWFPMLLSPSALDGSLAGDVGFDPIGKVKTCCCGHDDVHVYALSGFSKDKESLYRMREAEVFFYLTISPSLTIY